MIREVLLRIPLLNTYLFCVSRYLENIFSAEDIQKQLPAETTKFKQVDRFWKELFRKVKSKAW
jgi:hypothetical protein